MEGMENAAPAATANNEVQLVTNQSGQFAGYRKKSKQKNKFAHKKENKEGGVDMPYEAKKLFNLE